MENLTKLEAIKSKWTEVNDLIEELWGIPMRDVETSRKVDNLMALRNELNGMLPEYKCDNVFFKVTQGSEWGNYYFLDQEKANEKAAKMNELIEALIREGKNVDSRIYKVLPIETED